MRARLYKALFRESLAKLKERGVLRKRRRILAGAMARRKLAVLLPSLRDREDEPSRVSSASGSFDA